MFDHYCNQTLRLVLRSDQMPWGAALGVAVLELLGQQERNLNTDWLSCEINKLIWPGLMYDESVARLVLLFHACAIINLIKHSYCQYKFVLRKCNISIQGVLLYVLNWQIISRKDQITAWNIGQIIFLIVLSKVILKRNVRQINLN